MWCTSQTLTHLATCSSSEALQLWYRVNNTLVIWRTSCHCCVSTNGPLSCHLRWDCNRTDWVKAEHMESVLSQRGTNYRMCGASVCSHLSTDSRVITGRSAQIRTHKTQTQLACKLTTLALILTERIRCGVSQHWVGCATVTESTAGEAWEISNNFSLIDL